MCEIFGRTVSDQMCKNEHELTPVMNSGQCALTCDSKDRNVGLQLSSVENSVNIFCKQGTRFAKSFVLY